MKLPRSMGDPGMATEVRAAIAAARAGEGSGVVWTASPSDGTTGPGAVVRAGAIALAVIAAVVAALFVVAPAGALAAWLAGMLVLAGFGWEWHRRSSRVSVHVDGRIVVASPLRTVDVDLRPFGRVTVKVDRTGDDAADAVPFN